jgi:hypothetical protein
MKKFGTLSIIIISFIAGIAFVYSCGDAGTWVLGAPIRTDYLSMGYDTFIADNYRQPFSDSSAPVNLPHNSNIKSISGYFTDDLDNEYAELIFITFGRDGTVIDEQYLSTESISSYGSTTLNFPDNLAIDNVNHYYCLQWLNPNNRSELILHGVLIEYEYDLGN